MGGKMRWIYRIFVALVAFVVVAIGLLFLLPTDRIGQLASDQLKKQTGRTLTLSGDFSPTLYPTLGVKTGRITISNADWATEPVMVSADGAAVGVNLLALIGGNVEIDKLDLISPIVHLERAKDGRANWELQNTAAAGSASSTSSGASTTPTLELGSITDGQIVFSDRATGATLNITDLNGTIALPKGDARATVDMSAIVDGRKGAVKGTIADLQAFMNKTATTINGTFSIDGANLGLNGIAQLTNSIPNIDANFTADIADPHASASAFGMTLPEQTQLLKNIAATGQLRLNTAGLNLNTTASASYDGQAASVTAAVSSIGDWLSTPEFDSDISVVLADIGKLSYNGRFGQGAENFADGDLATSFTDLRRLMKLVGADPATPKGTFQTGSATGTFALTPAGKYRLRNATLKLDQNTLTGAISITPKEPRPLLLAQLKGSNLDFSAYTGDSSNNSNAANTASSNGSSGWSKDPITLKGLDAVDADVRLYANGINLGVSQLGITDLTAQLRDGLLTLNLRDVRVFQGAMAGTVNLRGGNSVAFATDVKANGVQIEPLLGQLLDMDRLRGVGNTTLKLKGTGQSLDQIMTSLSGNGTVKFTNGAIRGVDLAAMMRNLQSAFGGFEGATEFTSLDGTFSMEKGILKNVDLSLISPLFKAAGQGSVDIGGQAMNYIVTPTTLKDGAEFSVPVIITGPWQNLKFRPDLEKLLNLLANTKLKDSEEAQKIKKKLDDAKAKLKDPEAALKKKLLKELSQNTDPAQPEQKSLEEQAKDKLEDEIGNALKKLFD